MIKKLFSIIVVLVLAITCLCSLTACTISDVDYVDYVKTVAREYYSSHEEYDQYSDITLSWTENNFYEERSEVDSSKKDVIEENTTVSVATKKKGDVRSVEIKEYSIVNSTIHYKGADDKVKAEEKTIKIEERRLYSTRMVGGETVYTVTYFKSQKTNNEEEVVVKQYYDYNDKDTYIYITESVLGNINDKLSAFFEIANYGSLSYLRDSGATVKLSEDKEKTIVTAEIILNEYVAGATYQDVNKSTIIEFVDGSANKYVKTSSIEDYRSKDTSDLEMTVTYKAIYQDDISDTLIASYSYGYNGFENYFPW